MSSGGASSYSRTGAPCPCSSRAADARMQWDPAVISTGDTPIRPSTNCDLLGVATCLVGADYTMKHRSVYTGLPMKRSMLQLDESQLAEHHLIDPTDIMEENAADRRRAQLAPDDMPFMKAEVCGPQAVVEGTREGRLIVPEGRCSSQRKGAGTCVVRRLPSCRHLLLCFDPPGVPAWLAPRSRSLGAPVYQQNTLGTTACGSHSVVGFRWSTFASHHDARLVSRLQSWHDAPAQVACSGTSVPECRRSTCIARVTLKTVARCARGVLMRRGSGRLG